MVGTAAVVITGCSARDATYTVAGTVTLDGQPLPDVIVLFDQVPSLDSTTLRSARASTDLEGNYRLATFRKNDGAVAGRFRVIVVPALVFGDASPDMHAGLSRIPTIPEKYTDFASTPLEFEIKPASNHIDIALNTDT